jgi:hypothetical protein
LTISSFSLVVPNQFVIELNISICYLFTAEQFIDFQCLQQDGSDEVDDKKQEKENLSPESTGNEQSTEESDGDIDLTFDSAKHKLEDVSSKGIHLFAVSSVLSSHSVPM